VRWYGTTRLWESVQLRGSRWDENERMSIYPGVSQICTLRHSVHLRYPCISVHRPSLINHVHEGHDHASWEMHLEARIEWTQRCTPRPSSSQFGDTLGGRDRLNSEMHFEAVIERVWRCSLRPWSSEVGDAIGDQDWVNSEMHWEAIIERLRRWTCRLWSSEIGGVLARRHWIWREARRHLRLYLLVNL